RHLAHPAGQAQPPRPDQQAQRQRNRPQEGEESQDLLGNVRHRNLPARLSPGGLDTPGRFWYRAPPSWKISPSSRKEDPTVRRVLRSLVFLPAMLVLP